MIIEPFNAVFFGAYAITIALIVILTRLLKDKSEKTKKYFLLAYCGVCMILFVLYKIAISVDREYLVAAELDSFNWFNELPLQLCNLHMFLIPLGLITNRKFFLGFSFYAGTLGCTMALVFPDLNFTGYSLFMPRILGYYGTHLLIFAAAILIVTLGFYKPKYKDMLMMICSTAAIAFVLHWINLLLRNTVCSYANYFFTFETNGISLLELCRKWIDIPYLYELPLMLILAVYVALLVTVINLVGRCKEKHMNKQ